MKTAYELAQELQSLNPDMDWLVGNYPSGNQCVGVKASDRIIVYAEPTLIGWCRVYDTPEILVNGRPLHQDVTWRALSEVVVENTPMRAEAAFTASW